MNTTTTATIAAQAEVMTETRHEQIGYSNNVEIIERELRERFGIDDNSHLAKTVAAHVWSAVCSQCRPMIRWGTPEIDRALFVIEWRLSRVRAAVSLIRAAQEKKGGL